MIFLIRAAHANAFELQNYYPLAKKFNLRIITSRHPLTPVDLPTTQLWSPTDLPNFPFRRQFFNRLFGGEQWLFGLPTQLKKYDNSNYRIFKNRESGKQIKKQKLIIHTAETYTPYTHQAIQLKKAGLIDKLICTCWETIPHNNEKFARFRRWKLEAYKYTDLFHTPTRRAKAALIAEGVNPRKIKVIPYGIDVTRFHPSHRAPNRRPLILSVLRLTKEKGAADLDRLAYQLPQADFLVVGQGSYRFTAPNLRITKVSYSQIHSIYRRANAFLLLSHHTETWEEQYGMVLLEAMSTGLPIIAYRNGAIPEVLGSAAVTLPECDLEKVRIHLLRIINVPCLRRSLSQRARKRALTHFDYRQAAQKLDSLYAV